MKALGSAATFVGAITLMFAIIVAQINYQHNWTASAGVQTTGVAALPAMPERLAANN